MVMLAGALATLVAAPAAADEVKTPISASMFLNQTLSTPRAESRDAAYDESLKRGAPVPRDLSEGEVLPDGSVRYGKVTVTVRNPCPPGTAHYEPPPLPGRRVRN
jgi:hypothetical protein